MIETEMQNSCKSDTSYVVYIVYVFLFEAWGTHIVNCKFNCVWII